MPQSTVAGGTYRLSTWSSPPKALVDDVRSGKMVTVEIINSPNAINGDRAAGLNFATENLQFKVGAYLDTRHIGSSPLDSPPGTGDPSRYAPSGQREVDVFEVHLSQRTGKPPAPAPVLELAPSGTSMRKYLDYGY